MNIEEAKKNIGKEVTLLTKTEPYRYGRGSFDLESWALPAILKSNKILLRSVDVRTGAELCAYDSNGVCLDYFYIDIEHVEIKV